MESEAVRRIDNEKIAALARASHDLRAGAQAQAIVSVAAMIAFAICELAEALRK